MEGSDGLPARLCGPGHLVGYAVGPYRCAANLKLKSISAGTATLLPCLFETAGLWVWQTLDGEGGQQLAAEVRCVTSPLRSAIVRLM